jgi:single-strand DNA-binding protein
MSTNTVVIRGNLCRDPEVKFLASGTEVGQFAIALNERRKDKVQGTVTEIAHFFDVKCFGQTANLVGEYLRKGSNCIVTGRLAQEKWQTKEGDNRSRVVIVAERVDFVTRAPKSEDEDQSPRMRAEDERQDEQPRRPVAAPEDEENMPF